MRRIVPGPELFTSVRLPHKQALELEMIDRYPTAAAEAVWKDLKGPLARTGRPGLSADQVVRAVIVKQMNGYSYEDIAFHLAKLSLVCQLRRSFDRVGQPAYSCSSPDVASPRWARAASFTRAFQNPGQRVSGRYTRGPSAKIIPFPGVFYVEP